MGKILKVALHEFKVNFLKKQYLFFAFVLPAIFFLFSLLLVGDARFVQNVSKLDSGTWLLVVPSAVAIIFSMAIFLSANYLLQGIAVEKENRILEVLLSAISFKQLLIGKIVGLGLLGVVQVFTWGISSLLLVVFSLPETARNEIAAFASPEAILFYAIFFVLGYFMYASLLAVIGVFTETRGEAQQIGSLITVFAWVPVSSLLFMNTEVGFLLMSGLSFFPFTAPVASIIRVFTGTISLFEVIASICIIIGTTAIIVSVGSRIFRVESLIYGRRVSFGELVRVLGFRRKI